MTFSEGSSQLFPEWADMNSASAWSHLWGLFLSLPNQLPVRPNTKLAELHQEWNRTKDPTGLKGIVKTRRSNKANQTVSCSVINRALIIRSSDFSRWCQLQMCPTFTVSRFQLQSSTFVEKKLLPPGSRDLLRWMTSLLTETYEELGGHAFPAPERYDHYCRHLCSINTGENPRRLAALQEVFQVVDRPRSHV